MLCRTVIVFMPYMFSEMNNYQLIQNIKIRRALWDKALWDRIDGSAREVMWEDVADQMKTSKEIVKARWKNLRDSYRKLLLKHLSNPDLESNPRWRYFRHLEFIRDIVLNTKSKVGDISIKNSEIVSIEPDYSLTLETSTDCDTHDDPLSFGENVTLQDIKVERNLSLNSKGKANEGIPNYTDMEMDKSDTNDKYTMGYTNTSDDDLQFLLSLHQHLKQVPLHRKLPLRMSIEKIIYDEAYPNKPGNANT